MLCSSFSKTPAPASASAGARGPRHKAKVEQLKATTTLAAPTFPQTAVAESLASGHYDHHLRRVRRLYAEQVARFCRPIEEFYPDGTRLTRPAGGSVLWVKMPPGTTDALALHERSLAMGISIAPGPIFLAKGALQELHPHQLRLRLVRTVERAMKTLRELALNG